MFIKLRKQGNRKKLISLFLCFFLFLFSCYALQDYGVYKLNEEFSFIQSCSEASYITLSSIKTPTKTLFINENMTSVGSGSFIYNYTPSEVGRHDFLGISDGCEKTFAVSFLVTYDGLPSNYSKTDIYYTIFLFIAFFLSVASSIYAISKDTRFLFFSSIGFFICGLIISFLPTGLSNTNISDSLTILFYGLAFVSSIWAIWEWLPEN
ncbi:MAG: hypothetical protein NC935_02240 [Candidatus Omnitrophica bacterium]|nr:hypothetical protein [Candidatus Omnitrophota bacterium]